jgi:F-type H+-transporting ATPase subunit a
MFPPGVPTWIYGLLAPIEFVSTILVRPLTLGLRLFANMFAGHLLLLVFILGGDFMLTQGTGALPWLSPFAFLMAIVLTFFEALIQVLQAYIFVLLTALYIAGALVDEH